MRLIIRDTTGITKVVSLDQAAREWVPAYPSALDTLTDPHERLYQDSSGGFYTVWYECGVPKSGAGCTLQQACAWLVYHGYPLPSQMGEVRWVVDVDRISVMETTEEPARGA